MSTPASPSRTIFLDVDGTILEHGAVMAPSTPVAVRAARAAGHKVFVCTGRSDGDIHPDVLAIGFDGAITNGGAFGTLDGDLVIAHPMPRADVERLISFFAETGMEFFLQSHENLYGSPGVLAMIGEFIRQRREREAEDRRRLGLDDEDSDDLLDAVIADADARYLPLSAANLDEIAKAVFVSTRSDDVDRAQTGLGSRFHVIPGSMVLPGGSNGEISLAGVNKGAAIVEMLGMLGRPASEAIGIGDSWNDVEMFEVCGTAVAMGGADPVLQAKADWVTTGVLDDGISNAFVRLGLI